MQRRRRLAFVSWLVLSWGAMVARDARASCGLGPSCTGLEPVCSTGVCVACLANHNDAGLPPGCPTAEAPYCQLADSGALGGSCTQCGPGEGNSSLCDADHPVCLADGTCGCTDASQCGAGLTCDQGTQSCVPSEDGGSADGGSADGGASDAGGAGGADAGGDGGEAIDASSSDGSASEDASSSSDGALEDGAPVDAEGVSSTEEGGAGADGGAPDAGSATDASVADAEPLEGGETGSPASAGNGDYILGGGCSCTTGPDGAANAGGALVALALACAAIRRRRSRR